MAVALNSPIIDTQQLKANTVTLPQFLMMQKACQQWANAAREALSNGQRFYMIH